MALKLTNALHCHTYYSHGKNSIEEMVKEAVDLGLEKIVISEHGKCHIYARKLNNTLYREMKDTIIELRKKYPKIEILMGLEANVISVEGDIDVDKELLDMLDVLYVGFHSGIIFTGLKNYYSIPFINILNKKLGFKFLDKKCIKQNTQIMEKVLNKYPINMITHPTSRFNIDYKRIADICEQKNIIMEINSAREKLDANELKNLINHKVMFAVGTDAHKKEDILKWEKAKEFIIESKIPLERVVNVVEED